MTDNESQRQKFEKAAREIDTDDREEAFDAALKKIAKVLSSKDEQPAKSKD